MGCPRLMHSVATRMVKTPDTEPPGFHRDTDGFVFPLGFRNPHNDYQAAGGELYCSHISTWVSLCEVPEGTGFCVVPGSHQSHFEAPAGLPAIHVRRSPLRPACSAVQAVHSDERALLLPQNPPVSTTVPVSPGDVIIFSTNLLHAASNWTEDHPRYNIFQRFMLSAYFGLGEKSTNFRGAGYPMEEFRDRISDGCYELELPSKQEKEIVRAMRAQHKATAAL